MMIEWIIVMSLLMGFVAIIFVAKGSNDHD